MDLNIAQLKKMFDRVVDEEIELRKVKNLDKDYYWATDGNKRVNMDRPTELSVGSIEDDWQELVATLADGRVFTPVDVERFGNLLIAISEKMSTSR